MREIKFRAWDKLSKTMRYGAENNLVIVLNNPDFKVMQYTGFRDRNSREIYEGDIIQPKEMHDSNIFDWRKKPIDEKGINCEGILKVVKWEGDGFNLPYELEYWEVIGDVYEYPEIWEEELQRRSKI